MIIWHAKPPETTALSRQIDIIRVARTLDDNETELPSGMVTRIHTAKDPSLKLRWVSKITLGRGTYGKVFSALDIDTGDAFAVKRIKGPGSRERLKAIRREIEIMQTLRHVSKSIPHCAFHLLVSDFRSPISRIHPLSRE